MPSSVVNRHHPGVSFDVYVGRPSYWGNPFTVADHGRAAMRLYLDWLEEHPEFVDKARASLDGLVLACSCTRWPAPRWRPCHAVVLARLANGEGLPAIRQDVLSRVAEQTQLFP